MITFLRLLGFSFVPIQTVDGVTVSLAWGWAGVLLLLLALVPFLVWSYRLEGKPATSSMKGGLLGLRLAFLVGLLLLLAGLKFTVTGWIPQKNKLAIVLDGSRSMSIREDGQTRMERVRHLFGPGGFAQAIEQKTGIPPAFFAFSGAVAPLSREDVASFSLQPEGTQTNLSKAIMDVAGNLGEGNLLGVILITDGAYTHGDNPLEACSRIRTPLFFLGAGKGGQAQDLAVQLERPPSIGFLNSMARIRGEIRLFRIASDSVPITIRKNGKVLETLAVSVPAGQKRVPFAFNLPCEAEGESTYAVSVPMLPGELTYENNESSFLLKVVKERLNVVVVANRSSWEIAFLKGVVRSDPNGHLKAWARVTDDRWLRTVDGELRKPATKPDLTEDLTDADVLVVAGVPESILRPWAETITARVESGKMGLLFLPGASGYAMLGYPGSAFDPLFPVHLQDEEWRGTPANFVLPAREAEYAFLRLLDDPLENLEFFRTLPKLEGLYTYRSLRLGALTLLGSTQQQAAGIAPALVAQRNKQGLTAMFLGGPLWPMGFRLVPTDKTIRPYTAFLLNLMKWLANRREDALVTLEIPSARGFVGQPTLMRVWVSDNRRQSVGSAQVTANLTSDGVEPSVLSMVGTSEKGCYEGTFVPPRKGLYKIEVSARHQGQFLGETKGQFLVEVPTAEFDDPEVRVDLMTALASATGGAYRPIEGAGDLLSVIRPTPGQKRESKILELRDSGMILALLLLLPIIEWTWRRRKGYS
jgi:hypothetical protein